MTTFKHGSLRTWGIIAGVLLVGLMFRFAGFHLRPEADRSLNRAPSPRATLNLALVEAAKRRDVAQVKALLAQGADPNTRDQSAIKEWKKRMAEVATEQHPETGELRKHPRGEGARPYLGPTVLMIAAHQNDNATLQVLADAGADPNAKGVDYGAAQAATDSSVDLENQVTPLMEAMMSGEASTMRSLLQQGADVNARDSDGLTALDWAHNMTPTSPPTPQQEKFLDMIFSVLRQVKAKPSRELKSK